MELTLPWAMEKASSTSRLSADTDTNVSSGRLERQGRGGIMRDRDVAG